MMVGEPRHHQGGEAEQRNRRIIGSFCGKGKQGDTEIDQERHQGGRSFVPSRGVVVGKRLPPLQSHAIEWVRDWVRVIAALHHAIDKVEKPSLDGIRHHDSERPITYQSSSHLFPSSLFCFLVLAHQPSRCGYSLPTLLETKPPFL